MTVDVANNIIQYSQIAVSVVVLGLIFFKHRANALDARWLKKTAWFIALFSLAVVGIKIGGHYYFLAQDNAFGKFFLPPYQSWQWFAQDSLQKNLAPYAVALALGGFMYWAATLTNKYFAGDLFLKHDTYILFIAAVLVGWPGFMLYLSLVVILAVLYSVMTSMKHKTTAARVTLTNALIVSIPLVLIFGGAIAPYINLWKLTI
ncbi:hypothetical protein HY250_01105 [Candidatus Azambacteria bacterium]|nr:hypothetical protein [Candidatus Azambacteria bacterium]